MYSGDNDTDCIPGIQLPLHKGVAETLDRCGLSLVKRIDDDCIVLYEKKGFSSLAVNGIDLLWNRETCRGEERVAVAWRCITLMDWNHTADALLQ